jgi:hypothetical protein
VPRSVPRPRKVLFSLLFLFCSSGCQPDEVIILREYVFLRNVCSAYFAHVRRPPRILFGLDNLAIDRDRLVVAGKKLEVYSHAVDAG